MVCRFCNVSEDKLTPYDNGVLRCVSCGAIFRVIVNDTTGHHTKKFNEEEFTRQKNKKGDVRFWKLVSDAYVTYLKSKTSMDFKQVLDVGSYYGTFVKSLTDNSIDAEGIEANQNLVR